MQKRMLFSLILIITLFLAACAPAPAADDSGAAMDASDDAMAPSEIHVAWPYQPPPTGHFNTFVSDRINLGIYHHAMEPPLFMYMWADADWWPMAGASWEWADDLNLQVTIQSGAEWSDGSAFTSQDVVDTFDILRLQNQTVWRFLDSVEAVDDTTVNFTLTEPSTTVLRRILREANIRASSTYGELAQKTRDLVADGKTNDDPEWQALVQELNEFRPDDMVVLGPYKIDAESITDSQMILNKNESSFMAGNVNFDRIVNFNGETPDVTPLVLADNVDYATHGFPPATEREFMSNGTRIIRAPLFSGPALYFNHAIHPFELPEFRQAIAYAIDRDENGFVSLAESGRRQVLLSGFSDNMAPNWLSDDTQAALNHYDFDREKASEILEGLGFSRDDDGVWLDDTGARMEFELSAPAEFADWSAAAENAAQQLTDFGIQTTFRGVNFQQHPTDVNNGDFELAIRGWGAGNPHPHFAYDNNFRTHNAEAAGVGDGLPGYAFDLNQNGTDLNTLTDEAALGSDVDAQKAKINELALIYNELLPQIPLWERYGNNPVPSIRVAGWPADDDPIYLNGPYADPFTTVLLLNGTLTPAQ